MPREFYDTYSYDKYGYYTGVMPVENDGYPPDNCTTTSPPDESTWDGNWPKWTGKTWILEKDSYGQEYWPKGSTYKDSSLIWDKHGALPEGAITIRPVDPNKEQKDILTKQINDMLLELQDINTDIRYLERKVSRPTATEDDKGMLQECYKTKETLGKQLQELNDTLQSL